MKIMLADADKDLSRLAETILRASGHQIIKTVDASLILPSAQCENPDLILLDINIPGGKGSDILLKRSSLTSKIQVIVVSGITDPKGARPGRRGRCGRLPAKTLGPGKPCPGAAETGTPPALVKRSNRAAP